MSTSGSENFNYSGIVVTAVARKGNEKRVKDLPYEEALKAADTFRKMGWITTFYQQGFYQDNQNKY